MVKVALVGLGDIGVRAHLPALIRNECVHVAALVDTDRHRCQRARERSGAWDSWITDDLDEVLASDIPAVVLATPPWVTPHLAVRALRTGRYVLAEKPLATSIDAAEIYADLAEEETARLQVGLTYRHDPAIQFLAGCLGQGRLGQPVLARAHVYDERLDPSDAQHADRIKQTLTHGMPVIHEGAHVFDWLSAIFSSVPEQIDDAWALRTDPDLPSPNITGGRLRYTGGNLALVEFGWLTEALPHGEVSFLGPRGFATLHGRSFRVDLATASGHEVVEFPGEKVARSFDLQLERFLELASNERYVPDPCLSDGLAVLETAEHMARKALAGSE